MRVSGRDRGSEPRQGRRLICGDGFTCFWATEIENREEPGTLPTVPSPKDSSTINPCKRAGLKDKAPPLKGDTFSVSED